MCHMTHNMFHITFECLQYAGFACKYKKNMSVSVRVNFAAYFGVVKNGCMFLCG